MNTELNKLLDDMGVSMSFRFVPFSQSRNKDDESPSMNYIVTLSVNSREVLTTDYMMGCGHCKSYKQGRMTVHDHNLMVKECETGSFKLRTSPDPSPDDVMYSLVMDSDVIEHPSFESWASDFGYDEDSRSAESIYNACLKNALALRSALGDEHLSALREAYQDY